MPTQIWKCEEPRTLELLAEVRGAHHPHLEAARIVVLFRSPAASKGGRVTLGTASKASAKDRALLGEDADFLLTISADDWSTNDTRWKRALLDHELSHMIDKGEPEPVLDADGNPTEDEAGNDILAIQEHKWGLRGHDVEEFSDVVKRHGLWKSDLVTFAEILGQLELFPKETAQEPARAPQTAPVKAAAARKAPKGQGGARTEREIDSDLRTARALESDVMAKIDQILDPDGTGQTQVWQKGIGKTEFEPLNQAARAAQLAHAQT